MSTDSPPPSSKLQTLFNKSPTAWVPVFRSASASVKSPKDNNGLAPGSSDGSEPCPHVSDTKAAEDVPEAAEPQKRSRKKILCYVVPAIIVMVALALALGLYYGLTKGSSIHDGPVLDLGYSRYEGTYLSNGVSEFLGVRYAQPPTGDLRWRAPVAPKQTKGIQSAQSFHSYCPGVYQKLSKGGPDEDCLFANIWAPTNATAEDKLPVMVFIQGGGYTVNSNPFVNGSGIVHNSDRNMVFVSFNYRVGLFGFLSSEDVKNDGALNAGLLDQRFLLRWVQSHIPEFGGDPDHVVIQGVSAGAGSVALQLTAYGGLDEGLFAGAIAESTFMPGQHHYSDLEYRYKQVLAEAGCSDSSDKMACLRAKDAAKLQSINHDSPFEGRTGNPKFSWAPVTDGDLLQDLPLTMYERGDFVKVPILFGTCSNEGSQFVTNASTTAQFVAFMEDNYPSLTSNNTDEMLDEYPLEAALPTRARWFPSLSRAYGEATFICPTNAILGAFAAANSSSATIYSYRYNLRDNNAFASGRGVPHVFEVPAVFGPAMTSSASSYHTYNAAIVPVVQSYWVSFVRSLSPNTHRDQDAPYWQPWGSDEQRLVLQLPNSTMEDVPKNETSRCSFWRSINETISQ